MMMTKLNPSEIMPSINLIPVVGDSKVAETIRTLGYDRECVSDSDAAVLYEHGSQDVYVLFKSCVMEYPQAEAAALCAHEASHCVDAWLEAMAETNPGGEVRAYMLQACTQMLIAEVCDYGTEN